MSDCINPFTNLSTAAQTDPAVQPPALESIPTTDSTLSPQNPAESTTPPAAANNPPTSQNHTESHTNLDFPSPSLTPPSDLTPRQQTAISLLVSGHSISAVAATLSVSRWTLHHWKRDPAFLRELTKRQHEVCRASDARLRRLLLQTTQTALDSLGRKLDNRFQHAFRLLTILRPYIPHMNQPEPSFPTDAEIDAMLEPTNPKED